MSKVQVLDMSKVVVFLCQCIFVWISIPLIHVNAHGGGGGGGGDEVSSLRGGGLVAVKVWCMVIVFLATFVAGISPVFYKWNHGFLVLGTQFAGGVFLSVAMLHFLSDSNATFGDHTDKEYPFAFMLCVFGYCLTMLGDVVVHSIASKTGTTPPPTKSTPLGDVVVHSMSSKIDTITPPTKSTPDVETCKDTSNECACDNNELSQAPEAKSVATLVHKTTVGDTILLILALCFHSVFEGIAIGVAGTKADAWKVLWTVSLHKVFAAIAMGIALLRLLPNRPLVSCASYSFAFAISTPIGVAIGIIIDSTSEGDSADWTYAISMGLASGIFIYIAINHLLAKGFVPPCKIKVDQPLYKFLATLLGVAMIAIVMIWD